MRDQKQRTYFNAPSGTAEVPEQQIEAARYAVLRRLAPCLRHNLVRPLQPIGLIYGVMSHKLSTEVPDVESLRIQAEKISGFAKTALAECLYVGTWLAPEPGVTTEVETGVRECVGLLATMLHFCGFRLENEVAETPVQVKRDALRMVLIAALFEMTDSLSEPATVTISSSISKEDVTVVLQVSQKGEGGVERYDDGYRKLVWSDVQALAAADDVSLERDESRVTMRFAIERSVPVH
jgi:C4-dicarboxylate-specific signal transduction histidine kinase